MIPVRVVRIRVNQDAAGKRACEPDRPGGEERVTNEHGPRLTANHEKSVPVWCGSNVFTSNMAVGCGPAMHLAIRNRSRGVDETRSRLTDWFLPELVDTQLEFDSRSCDKTCFTYVEATYLWELSSDTLMQLPRVLLLRFDTLHMIYLHGHVYQGMNPRNMTRTYCENQSHCSTDQWVQGTGRTPSI